MSKTKSKIVIIQGRRRKNCTACRRLFPVTDRYWHRCKQSPSGFKPECKPCSALRHQGYMQRLNGHWGTALSPQAIKKARKKWAKLALYPLAGERYHDSAAHTLTGVSKRI